MTFIGDGSSIKLIVIFSRILKFTAALLKFAKDKNNNEIVGDDSIFSRRSIIITLLCSKQSH